MASHKSLYFHDDLENLSEELVFEEIHRRLQARDIDCCICPICIQDIAAVVLNRIPAVYVTSIIEKTSPSNTLQEKVESVREAIKQELPAAIELVKTCTHH